MGLLQRSFLDLAEQEGSLLQMAIVVDGTDSMASELAGVRQSITSMIEDLRRFRGDEIEIALVIYRDNGSPAGEVTIPLKSFSRDTDAIAAAVEQIVPQSGAPFFHELADVGIYTAIKELEWSSEPTATRWIMLFGDAPPYEETFRDANFPQARRRYSTELLVSLAATQAIRINCVLCTSDQDVIGPYDKAIAQTRTFMNTLASGTDGLMLDLSYPEIRTALIDASHKPDREYVAIAPITRNDINPMSISSVPANVVPPTSTDSFNQNELPSPSPDAATANQSALAEVRIAVLPHLPLDQMTADPKVPAVQIATELRTSFARIPGVRVVSPIDLQNQIRRLRADNVSDDQKLRALAARLGVDYVIWGTHDAKVPTGQTAAYRRTDGAQIVQVSLPNQEGTLTNVLLNAAANVPSEQGGALGSLLSRIEKSVTMRAVDQPLATTPATRREVLATIEALEQSLGLPAGSKESLELLNQASISADVASAAEPRNPIVNWLIANIAYNLASYHYGNGDAANAETQMKRMKKSLRFAFNELRSVRVESLATEIRADYALLGLRDTKAAIDGYSKLIADGQPSSSQRRGHWMLSGIYAGDWGVAEEVRNPKAAREHLVAILSGWPESPEAELLKKWMRWDDAAGKTKFSYLPIVNRQLAKIEGEGEDK
jgi:hypothetical protein